MRAVAFSEFGGPEVLSVVDLPVPDPGFGEVRIRVAAAAVNLTDLNMRAGHRSEPLLAFPPPYVPGMELAGTIDAVGPGASWLIGQQVMAIAVPRRNGRGGQSEFVVLPAGSVAPIPGGASMVEAATLPMNGLTVRRCLDLLGLRPGKWLAIIGAAGAVGSYAVELGVIDGLRVIAVASAADEEFVRGLGAEEFVARGDNAAERIRQIVPDGVDALVDMASIGAPCLSAIRDRGKFVSANGSYSGEAVREIEIVPTSVSDYAENAAALDELRRLASAGRLTLRVARTFPPERVADAHRLLAAGGVRGRLVITF